MEKTATLNLRVNPTVKKGAEEVLNKLGIPMSVAVDMYLNQIYLTGGIPFKIALPNAPASINADEMSSKELNEKLEAGYADMRAGRVQDAGEAFRKLEEQRNASDECG